MSEPLFPVPIPVMGGTGEFESGKTIFGLSICPGPKTRYYDFEQSGATYQSLGHDRVNVMAEMQKKFPNGYKPIDLWIWWRDDVRQLPKGHYRVIVIDPVTDLERGLTDWVAANPQAFGHSAAQYHKMQGIMWGDVKDHFKSILADLSVRCETLYFAAHLGMEFVNKETTGRKKIKGKSTLMELATVFLWFNRKPDPKTGKKPNKPSANVVKSRLMLPSMVDGELEMVQVLPPIMPVATPKAIRDAFKSPAGGREIDETEKVFEEEMSSEEKMNLELRIAEAKRDTELAKLAVGGSTVVKPTAPPEEELIKWLMDAKSMDELKEAGVKIKGYDIVDQLKNKLEKMWLARRDELAAKSGPTAA